jgi:hypothetical protein
MAALRYDNFSEMPQIYVELKLFLKENAGSRPLTLSLWLSEMAVKHELL